MGFCLSCCRRPQTGDREPLLPRHAQGANAEPLPHPQTQIDELADVFAALRSGKLPSQEQINVALRRLLRSDVLAINGSKSARVMGHGHQYGPLSGRGKAILMDFREALEAVVQFGLEKNDDNSVQDLVHEIACMDMSSVNVDIDVATKQNTVQEMENLASTIPSSEELGNDVRRLSRSLLTLSGLLLTSGAFRLLLSDILLTSRALLADVAVDVGRVARTVEVKAKAVEDAVRPDDKQSVDVEEAGRSVDSGPGDMAEDKTTEWEPLGEGSPDQIKQLVLEKLQKIVLQAQQKSTYKSALNTLLLLLRKYVERASTAASAVSSMSSPVTVTVDPHLAPALTDSRIILERLASGRSLRTLILYAEKTLHDLVFQSSPSFKGQVRQYFEHVGDWLDQGLRDPGFATSPQGRWSADQLYDRGRAVMQSEENAPWVSDARKVLDEVDAFVHALGTDKTTCRVADALEKLSGHCAAFGMAALGALLNGQRALREEAKRDVFGWVIPRTLRMLKTIPMPRVEIKTGALELVIDAAQLRSTSASFVPDHTIVQNWSEIRLEADPLLGPSEMSSENGVSGGVSTSTRTRVHIDGVRISAHRIGYYVKYTGPLGGLISWEDNGHLSLDVGTRNAHGEGVAIDIEAETVPANHNDSPVFIVTDVAVDVPGLSLAMDNSRHWIFNKLLLQPLAGPIVRRVLKSILASQIRVSLESLNDHISAVRTRARERVLATQDQEPSWEDYWEALLETKWSDEKENDSSAGEPSVLVADTHMTGKGVVHRTVTQPAPDESAPKTPSETIVAVGVGAQILPGKGGPQPDVEPVIEQVRDLVADVEDAADSAVRKAQSVGGHVMGAAAGGREELEEASERIGVREDLERRDDGWRSHTFDL